MSVGATFKSLQKVDEYYFELKISSNFLALKYERIFQTRK